LFKGQVSQYGSRSPRIEQTINPRIELPPPPKQPLYQITFDILIQFDPAIDTDILGASSYVVYEIGEVWCTERVLQRGQAIGLGGADGLGPALLFGIIFSFLTTVTLIILLVVVCLEIYSRYKEPNRES
jgi:hypothetical protein